jgi:hypothetical protein
MSKHTPGPWAIGWNVSRLDIFSADDGTLVATIQRWKLSSNIDDTAKANARLIAAAPDLLAFAQDFLLASAGTGETDSPLEKQARAAIAKAIRKAE